MTNESWLKKQTKKIKRSTAKFAREEVRKAKYTSSYILFLEGVVAILVGFAISLGYVYSLGS